GLYHADTRVLSGWDVSVGGAHGEAIAQAGRGSGEVTFTSLLRHLDDATADPRLRLEVTRTVSAGRMRERITIRSGLGHTVSTTIA
ncbi:glycogen debranching N-terminal domain-containing protein, partial [Pseudomonas sp. AB12(2023)]